MDASSGESELLAAAKARELGAVGELYRRHADGVFALAYRMLGSKEEAEDVLQDVFVGLPRALESYREVGRFEGWLKRVTVRAALMRLRSKRRKRETPLEEAMGTAVAAGSPIDRIALERALNRLPDSLRAVFVLREIEGYAHAEIGALLDITAASSAMRLSRAWSALRRELRS
jgi:RNA polymerase sigma-70 factor (ECF subfamily)